MALCIVKGAAYLVVGVGLAAGIGFAAAFVYRKVDASRRGWR
jgi:hypothetical protein